MTRVQPAAQLLREQVPAGATYLVHAHVVDPEALYVGSVLTVPLATNECSGSEQLGPPNPLIALTGLGNRGLTLRSSASY